MKRKTFVMLAAGGIAAFCLPEFSCKTKSNSFIKTLALPQALQHISDAKTIREIGEAYKKQNQNESDETILVKLLSIDKHGKPIPEASGSITVASLLDEKIRDDFQQNKTMIVDGWVLSVTEARQCALFSITEK